MLDKLKTIMENLETNIGYSDFPSYCKELVLEIKKLTSPSEAIEPLLLFMGNHQNLNYGTPGVLVRFIESFPEEIYVESLIKSIQKQPTEHNTWMLLKNMNTWSSPRQEEYIRLMKSMYF